MSGRSFDMTRKSAPARKVQVSSVQKTKPKKSEPKPKSPRPKKSLRERRERVRNRVSGLIFIVVVLLVGAVVYGFWRTEVRVSEIRVHDVPNEELATTRAKEILAGKYFGILPRDSIFFYPEKELQTAILDALPSLTRVSVARESFTALALTGERREAAFHWCGMSGAEFSLTEASCYEADTAGFIFARVGDVPEMASSTMLRIYAPLEEGGDGASPIRRTVVGTGYLPNLLEFVQAVKGFGLPVLSTFIQGDEAELFVTPKTRIMYVLGKEAEAIRNAEAGFKDLNLRNDSIEYVDLRFDGKLYVKRYE